MTEPTLERSPASPRLLAALVAIVAMFAGLLVASPAAAQEPPPPATLTFVNAFDDARFTAVVDPSASSRQEIDLKTNRTLSPIELAAGSHVIETYAGESTSGSPLASRTLATESGKSLAFVVHPGATGNVVTTVFTDDQSVTGNQTSRLVVRHVAAAGAVDVTLRPAPSSPSDLEATTDSFTLANGQQGVISGANAQENVLYELVVTPVGSSTPLIIDNEVVLTPGEVTTIYIAGNPPVSETSQSPESLLESTFDVGALPPPAINLVNGFTEGQYVFYVDGVQNASISSLRRNGALQGISEGTVEVAAYLNSGTPGSGTPAAALEIKVCDGRSYDLAIHASPSGAEVLTLFENDVRPVETGSTRFTVRHIAEYGQLDVDFFPSNENPSAPGITADFQLASGDEEVISAPINDYVVEARNPGTSSGAVARNGDSEGEGGATQISYIMGTPPGAPPLTLLDYLPTSEEAVLPNATAPGGDCVGGQTTSNPTTPDQGVTGSQFTAIEPTRIINTRKADPGPLGKLQARTSLNVAVAGSGEVPADATAVTVNLTVADTEGPGYLSAAPTAPSGKPSTSNLNYTGLNQERAVMATVPLADDGSFAVYTSTGANVIVDVFGYYTAVDAPVATGRFIPLAPERLFDTRSSEEPVGKLEGGTNYTIPAAGVKNVPASGVSALVMNLTAFDAESFGFLKTAPTDAVGSKTSSLNYDASRAAVANQVIVKLDADGAFSLSSRVDTHALGDVVGYFTDETASVSDTGLFVPVSPIRVADSRRGLAADDRISFANPLDLDVAGPLEVAPSEISAVAMTVVATGSFSAGWIRVSPEPTETRTSTVNMRAGDDRANHVYSGIQSDGTVSIDAPVPVHVVADLTGYFTS